MERCMTLLLWSCSWTRSPNPTSRCRNFNALSSLECTWSHQDLGDMMSCNVNKFWQASEIASSSSVCCGSKANLRARSKLQGCWAWLITKDIQRWCISAPSQKNETNDVLEQASEKTFKISQNDTYVIWLKKQKNTQKSSIIATPSLSELSPRGVFFYAPHQCGRCQGCWESPRRQRHIGPSPDLQVMRGNSGHKALEILRKKSGETKSSSAKSQLEMDYWLTDIDGMMIKNGYMYIYICMDI